MNSVGVWCSMGARVVVIMLVLDCWCLGEGILCGSVGVYCGCLVWLFRVVI